MHMQARPVRKERLPPLYPLYLGETTFVCHQPLTNFSFRQTNANCCGDVCIALWDILKVRLNHEQPSSGIIILFAINILDEVAAGI
jgi:hypothetical protein